MKTTQIYQEIKRRTTELFPDDMRVAAGAMGTTHIKFRRGKEIYKCSVDRDLLHAYLKDNTPTSPTKLWEDLVGKPNNKTLGEYYA